MICDMYMSVYNMSSMLLAGAGYQHTGSYAVPADQPRAETVLAARAECPAYGNCK